MANSKTPAKKKAKPKVAKRGVDKPTVKVLSAYPCDNCLMLQTVAAIQGDGSLVLQMHMGCAHAMATSWKKIDDKAAEVGKDMEVAVKEAEAKLAAQPAPGPEPTHIVAKKDVDISYG